MLTAGATYADTGADVRAALDTHLPETAETCLEMGTLQWKPGVSTSVARTWFPQLLRVTGTDIEAGPGVDIVADAHDLTPVRTAMYDLVICRSVLEHLARPWWAVYAMERVLKPGGLVFIDTHQTFPVHGYPSDFFRFSTEALRVLCEDAGLAVLAAGYVGPADIVPRTPVDPWNKLAPAFLNVQILARKA